MTTDELVRLAGTPIENATVGEMTRIHRVFAELSPQARAELLDAMPSAAWRTSAAAKFVRTDACA